MFCNVSLKLNKANRRRVSNALGPETKEQMNLAKNEIRFDLQLPKVTRTLELRGHEKFDNSFILKLLV